jgi:hypothetical protein
VHDGKCRTACAAEAGDDGAGQSLVPWLM